MSLVQDDLRSVCVNHPRRDTVVRCGKCGNPICTQCMIQTPLGMRCRQCAGLRKLPQYQVDPVRLVPASVAGLITSLISWFLLSGIPFIGFILFFLSVFVGMAVGEVMSRVTKRRVNRILEVAAVVVIVLGRLAVLAVQSGGDLRTVFDAANNSPMILLSLIVPVAVASWLAILKLR